MHETYATFTPNDPLRRRGLGASHKTRSQTQRPWHQKPGIEAVCTNHPCLPIIDRERYLSMEKLKSSSVFAVFGLPRRPVPLRPAPRPAASPPPTARRGGGSPPGTPRASTAAGHSGTRQWGRPAPAAPSPPTRPGRIPLPSAPLSDARAAGRLWPSCAPSFARIPERRGRAAKPAVGPVGGTARQLAWAVPGRMSRRREQFPVAGIGRHGQ